MPRLTKEQRTELFLLYNLGIMSVSAMAEKFEISEVALWKSMTKMMQELEYYEEIMRTLKQFKVTKLYADQSMLEAIHEVANTIDRIQRELPSAVGGRQGHHPRCWGASEEDPASSSLRPEKGPVWSDHT